MSDTVIECAFTGRVGQEPALRTSKTGQPWLAVSVAVGSGDDIQWLQVAVFGDPAAELATRLTKGTRVYVEGRLRLNKWTKDGREHAGLSVAATLVQPLGQIGRKRPGKAGDKTTAAPLHRENAALPTPGPREQRHATAQRDWQRPPRTGRNADIPSTAPDCEQGPETSEVRA